MISKFYPAGHLILIFIIKILPPPPYPPPPRTIWAFQGVTLFSNKCSCTIYTKSALDLVRQYSLKMMFGGNVWTRGQKNFMEGGGRSTMDDAMLKLPTIYLVRKQNFPKN